MEGSKHSAVSDRYRRSKILRRNWDKNSGENGIEIFFFFFFFLSEEKKSRKYFNKENKIKTQ